MKYWQIIADKLIAAGWTGGRRNLESIERKCYSDAPLEFVNQVPQCAATAISSLQGLRRLARTHNLNLSKPSRPAIRSVATMEKDLQEKVLKLGQLGAALHSALKSSKGRTSMGLEKTRFNSLYGLSKRLARFQYSIVIDSIQNCEYDPNFAGWVQPVPIADESSVAVNFTFTNNSASPVTGYFVGYINGVPLKPTAHFISNLNPRDSFKGVMTALDTPVGTGSIKLILIEGFPPYVRAAASSYPLTQTAANERTTFKPDTGVQPAITRLGETFEIRPTVLTSLEMPYFAGTPMSMASAIRDEIGISVSKDGDGNIQSAEGTDLYGIRRKLTIARDLTRLTMEYSEDTGGGYVPVYTIFSAPDFAYAGDTNFALDLDITEYPKGGPGTGFDKSVLSYRIVPTSSLSANIALSYEHFPSAPGPGYGGGYPVPGGGVASYDVSLSLKGQYSIPTNGNASLATLTGDDLSFDNFLPNFTKKISFFASVFADDPSTIASFDPLFSESQGGNTNTPGLGVSQQALSAADALKLGIFLTVSGRVMCEGAKIAKIVWWAWALCLGTVAANSALALAVTKLESDRRNKGGGSTSGGQGGAPSGGGSSSQGPVPFPSNAECLVDSDCPDGFICLNGVCVPLAPAPGDQADEGI